VPTIELQISWADSRKFASLCRQGAPRDRAPVFGSPIHSFPRGRNNAPRNPGTSERRDFFASFLPLEVSLGQPPPVGQQPYSWKVLGKKGLASRGYAWSVRPPPVYFSRGYPPALCPTLLYFYLTKVVPESFWPCPADGVTATHLSSVFQSFSKNAYRGSRFLEDLNQQSIIFPVGMSQLTYFVVVSRALT